MILTVLVVLRAHAPKELPSDQSPLRQWKR
jgi:hypothetical protein